VTEYLFPDNTVLCNFACVNRLDLLRSVLRGRGRWTASVAYEASRSARLLTPLYRLPDEGWLGEPIEITDEGEIQRIERIRRAVFGGSVDRPTQHLGEAETCFLIKEWPWLRDAWWITDDGEALRHARFQGITTRETIDLLATAVVDGELAEQAAYALMQRMADEGRALRLPKSPNEFRR